MRKVNFLFAFIATELKELALCPDSHTFGNCSSFHCYENETVLYFPIGWFNRLLRKLNSFHKMGS